MARHGLAGDARRQLPRLSAGARRHHRHRRHGIDHQSRRRSLLRDRRPAHSIQVTELTDHAIAQSVVGLQKAAERTSPKRPRLRAFARHRLAVFGAVVIGTLVLVAIFAPFIATHDPNEIDLFATSESPSSEHWLGTDDIGREVFSRVVYGTRVSLSVGLVAVTIYVFIGTILGAISGYFGGWVDSTIQRFTDAVMCFPSLIIIIAAVAIIGPSIYNVMIVIGLLTWPGICRLVRGQFLSLREREFVEAARSMGAQPNRIIFRHLLPNAVAPITVAATFGVAAAILTEAGLSFFGLV